MKTVNWKRKHRAQKVLHPLRYRFSSIDLLADELLNRNDDHGSLLNLLEDVACVFGKFRDAGFAIREFELGGPIINGTVQTLTGNGLVDLNRDFDELVKEAKRMQSVSVVERRAPDLLNQCDVALLTLESHASIQITPISRGESEPALVTAAEGNVRTFGAHVGAVFVCRKPETRLLFDFVTKTRLRIRNI